MPAEDRVPQIEYMERVRRATRLAAQGKYSCNTCGKIGELKEGLVVSHGGNVLLATCPGCITDPIVISRNGGTLSVKSSKACDRRIVLASELQQRNDVVLPRPVVARRPL